MSDFNWPPEGEGGSCTEESSWTNLSSVAEGQGEGDVLMRHSVAMVEHDEPLHFNVVQAVADTDHNTKVIQH